MGFLDGFFNTGGDTTTTSVTNPLATAALPYYEDYLGKVQTAVNQPYTPYQGQRIADASADTLASYDAVRNASTGSNTALQSAISGATAGLSFSAPTITSQNIALPANVVAGKTGSSSTTSQNVSTPTGVTTGNFDFKGIPDANISQYLNPYTTNVLDVQKQRMAQSYQEQQAGRDAAAVSAGAFGGDRRFVADSLAQRDYNQQLQETEATGLQAAYNNATGLFETDEARRLQGYNADADRRLTADTGNADRYVTVNAGNANRLLTSDQGNADRLLTSDTGNANRDLTASTGNADRTVTVNAGNADRALSASQANATAAVAAANARNAAAGTLGSLATSLQNSNLANAAALAGIGSDQQNRTQAGLDLAYQDFQNQNNYPIAQAKLYGELLGTVPTGTNSTTATTQPAPSLAQQLIGLATAGAGAYGASKS